MAILGIESLEFGVEDMALCARFWDDYGLNPVSRSADRMVWDVASGSRIIIRPAGHPALAPAVTGGSTMREAVFGVDTAEALEQLVAGLAVDRDVTCDADGTAHFAAPDGNRYGLRVWNKKPVLSAPDPVNAPGHIVRLNQHRKWRLRARPKTINHVVYFSEDYVGAYEFFRDRLGFSMTDHAKANGVFARADGTHEHHTIFWVTTAHARLLGKRGFNHCAFGVEDIDELMTGANYMQDRGWSDERAFAARLNRHRISSAMYYYFPNPNGGDAEYHADTDYLDSGWIPRVWETQFGASLWGMQSPGFFRDGGAMSWDVTLDPDELSLEKYRDHGRKAEAARDAAAEEASGATADIYVRDA
jgi:catechol 2,3-dioxygenase-like lactoylglutathione lyase family enzyme